MIKDYDIHWLKKCEIIKLNSTCLRRQVGCCVVNKHGDYMVYDGCNHSVLHSDNCKNNVYCKKQNLPSGTGHDICNATHAEQSVLMTLLRNGVSPVGMTLYVNYQPCIICARLICESGIKRVVYSNRYPDYNAIRILEESNVEVLYLPITKKCEVNTIEK